MRRRIWIVILFVLTLAILAGLVDWPTGPNIRIGSYFKEMKIHRGLDLQGGTHLIYELDTSNIASDRADEAQKGVVDVIDRRINGLGVAEPVIQTARLGSKRALIIELPGVEDVNHAISLIGQTAQLRFLEIAEGEQGFAQTQLSGAHLVRADVKFDPNTGKPEVSLKLNDEGAKIFEEITKKNLQKPIAIQLDETIISAPTVQSVITGGNAVITGDFTVQQAKDLALQLNSGALPVPLKLVSQRNVEATLGAKSVSQSLFAGLIGLLLVSIFMIAYYRVPGLLAVLALFLYTLIVLSLFKLIPITLTLAGIAGFILSIGMAVDANILIFERMREELREGKPLALAIEEGFRRAWSSIRDSNISSLITAAILYYGTTGVVRGFAVTLAIGILISMFTAITTSRTLLRAVSETRFAPRLEIK